MKPPAFLTAFMKSLEAIPQTRLRYAFMASLLVAVFLVLKFELIFLTPDISDQALPQDYDAFYSAARLAVTGETDGLYTRSSFFEILGRPTTLLWLYPPSMLLFIAPFGFAPFWLAKLIWVGLILTAAFWIAYRVSGKNIAIGIVGLLSPVTYTALFVGQMSALFAALLAGGLLMARKQPVLSGLCFALLTLKPQFGLLVIPFLVIMRAWKAMAVAAIGAVALIALSALIFGADLWTDFANSILNGAHADFFQSSGHRGRITIADAIKMSGFSAPPALLLYPPLIAAAIGAIYYLKKHNTSEQHIIAFTLLASAAVSPYFFVYDYFVINAAVLMLAVSALPMGKPMIWLLIYSWFAPLTPLARRMDITPIVLWLLLAVTTVMVFRLIRSGEDRPAVLSANGGNGASDGT